MGQRQEWDVVVGWETGQKTRGTGQVDEVAVTFDGIGYAPKGVSLWLVDTVTGQRIYMRTQSAYRFKPQEGETSRRFKIIAELGNERPLRIVGLKATPMRGQGVVVEFGLTKPAQVVAEVLTLTGRRAAVLEGQTTRSAGTHRLIWRGTNGNGVAVGTGVFLVRLIATDEEGRQVQAVTTVSLR
ncbi:hypothetical protein HRbin17_02580 [bacterium HR17]|uniref:FlgD Ig-like domain-containing protein n=1 Tax=Candidatus Fervidibacter japonicus TaxID=2035412 RepID=A0A2H5XFU5_9BACT|nr:hypothetical protein HRbin17_02580 [bacterium HR17]